MTRPLQTTCSASAEATFIAKVKNRARSKGLSCIVELFCCVVGRERLQSFGPQHRYFVVVLALENVDGRVWIGRRINARIQNLGEIFRLLAGLMLAHEHYGGDDKERERGRPRPNQSGNRPPRRRSAVTGTIFPFVRDALVQLMTKEFLVAQCLSCELFLQKRAQPEPIAFFGFGRFQIRQRSLEFSYFFAAQLSIEPGSPFFFKRFHKLPSGNSATSYGHKTGATSPCRWNSQGFGRSRDTAFLRFLSSKLLRGAQGRAARWRG